MQSWQKTKDVAEGIHQSAKDNSVLEFLTCPNQIQWILVGLELPGQSRSGAVADPYTTSIAYAKAKITGSHFERAAVYKIGEGCGEVWVDYRARVGGRCRPVREGDEVKAGDGRRRRGAPCEYKS